MRTFFEPPPPTSPEDQDRLSYEAALQVCGESGDWKQAVQLLDLMAVREVERRLSAWNSALAACATARNWEKASELLTNMRAADLTPDHDSYHAVAEASAEEAPELALEMMSEMREKGLVPALTTYCRVIEGLSRNSMQDAALEEFRKARDQGVFQLWSRSGNLDLTELPNEVAQVATHAAIVERAESLVERKAGRGGVYIFTGPSTRKGNFLQRDVLKVLQDFGLKVRKDPERLGRMLVPFSELQRLGKELAPVS